MHRMRTLRARLVMWTVAINALLLLVLGAGVWWALRQAERNQIDATLSLSAAQLVTAVDKVDGKRVVPNDDASALIARGVFAWVMNEHGSVDATVGRATGTPPAMSSNLAQVRLGGDVEESRLLRVPLNEIGGQVIVGASLEPLERTSRLVALAFATLAPVVLALSALGGAFLAGRALSPISSITAQARRIGRDNLSERLSLAGPDDEVHALSATFDDMLDRLQRAFESEQRFTSDASHELRTPLGLLKTQLSLAASKPRDAAQLGNMIVAMEGDVDRMTRLVEHMLALSRSEQPLVQRSRVDLSEMLGALVSQLQLTATEHHITLSLSTAASAMTTGDADRLTQLFLNVLDNALKYTGVGGSVRVAIALEGDTWRIAVADTGTGIAPDHLPHIFDRFYRADASRTRQTGGEGLGLSIAQAIAHQHGGRIDVESELGKGSTFIVRLPKD